MVQESVVLFGIEHLQKCACRVPINATSDLVHLINENERILRTDSLESLDDFSRKGTTLASVRALGKRGVADTPDISPPMTLNLRNVRQPANRESEELPPESPSDRLANRRLAHTWRTGQANDLALHAAT